MAIEGEIEIEMSRKKIITISSVIGCIAVISVGLAVLFGGNEGPDFTGKKPEEIKAYFKSQEYQSLDIKEQIAIKKKAYAPYSRQREQELIEQVKAYSQLPPRQKVAYLDEIIDQMTRKTEKKQSYAKQTASGAKQVSQSKGGNGNSAGKSSGKNWDSPEGFRNWSESMDPEKRAYIMEIKEAVMERMEQRGIEIR